MVHKKKKNIMHESKHWLMKEFKAKVSNQIKSDQGSCLLRIRK